MDSIVHPPPISPNAIYGLGGMPEGTTSPILRQQREQRRGSRHPTYLTDDSTTETNDHPTTDDLALEHKVPRVVEQVKEVR